MNKFFLILFFLCSSSTFIAQQRDKSVILYDRGNAAVARKDYRTADSLFTLSLNLSPHPDSYYNRAVCRRQLNDFKGYCLDLDAAAGMGDSESYRLYWKQCAKRDTIFKKNSGDAATKKDFEYVEFITSYKYNTDFDYSKHDTAGNCILSKIRTDNVVFYRNCKEVTQSTYKGSTDSLINYIKSHTEFTKHVKQNDWAEFTHISVIIDEKGKITDIENEVGLMNDGSEELKNILLNMTDWSPAIYNNKPVKFKQKLSIDFYNDVIEISEEGNLISSGTEIFSKVEIMPDFPGGISNLGFFIQKNLTYPQMAKENGLMGKCFLRFTINADGTISDIKVLKGVPKCLACDKEAVRMVSSMPKWKPGTQNGKPVPVLFNLPINFQLR